MPRMSTSRTVPLCLLFGFGLLIGAIPPLVKVGAALGVSAAQFAFVQSLGSGLLILFLCAWRRQLPSLNARHLRYYLIAGLTGNALPNELLFLAVPHLGAGLTSLVYCFSPLFTLVLALVSRVERPTSWRVGGILLGFAATLMIAMPGDGQEINALWLGVTLLGPVSLAFGNVYRTRDWPPSGQPRPLAAGMMLAGALWLSPLLVWSPSESALVDLPDRALLILGTAIVLTAIAYVMFLELQRISGPIYLSQIGYVITLTGLAGGVLLLDEHYGLRVWLAVVAVFVGVAMATVPAFVHKDSGTN